MVLAIHNSYFMLTIACSASIDSCLRADPLHTQILSIGIPMNKATFFTLTRQDIPLSLTPIRLLVVKTCDETVFLSAEKFLDRVAHEPELAATVQPGSFFYLG